jgi:hypothetical protein
LQKQVHFPQRSSYYHPIELILSILYALIAGIPRLSRTKILQGNGAFQKIIGLKKFPYASSLRRFLKRIDSQDHSKYHQSSRSVQTEDVLSPQSPYQPSVRFRLFSAHPLWEADRGSRDRVQSLQKRGSVLSSSPLFRISHQGLLAWPLETWKRLYLFRCPGISQRMSPKGSPWDLPYPSPSRFGFLRSQIYRTSGSRRDWLCHCSQDDSTDQKQSWSPSLSSIQEGLGSSRVFLQAFPMGRTTPFCSHSSSSAREGFRTTDALYPETIQLSGLCHQSSSPCRRDLVFLSAQDSHRGHYPRAERKLCFGQDSHQQFSSQSVLFPSFAVCLQSRQLVQKNLPTSKISEGHLRDHSDRILSSSREISQHRPSESSQTPLGVYFQGNFGSYYSKYQKDETIVNFYQFANFYRIEYSESPIF